MNPSQFGTSRMLVVELKPTALCQRLHPTLLSPSCSTSLSKMSSTSVHPLSTTPPTLTACPPPLKVTDRSWINTANLCQRVMRADQAPTHRRREKSWWEPAGRQDVLVWELGGAQTLTVNYLENMAIGAAMSVSEPLSMICSLGTCRPIQLTDCLPKMLCLKSYFNTNSSGLPQTARLHPCRNMRWYLCQHIAN